MERLTTQRIATATTLATLGFGALVGCGQEQSTDRTNEGTNESCNGLPAYEVVRRTVSGDPVIKFANRNEDCHMYLYHDESGINIPNSYIDKDSRLLVSCKDKDEIWVSILENGDISNTGYATLGKAASRQVAQDQNVRRCV